MTVTSRSASRFLRDVRTHVASGRVRVADYALERAFDELGWDESDILDCLLGLGPTDFLRCEASRALEGGTIWIFCPDDRVVGLLWIRLTIRDDLIVVSLHRA